MKIQHIGVVGVGDMGQAIAQQLKQKGFNVYTALDKRSARTRELARQAGLTDVGSIEKLTAQCDVLLSIMNPAAALEFATEVARAISTSRSNLLFVDCNSIAPATIHSINETIIAAGGRCADMGIVGGPPRGRNEVVVYVSGPEARELEQLATPQIVVRYLSERMADASAVKLCYSAVGKCTAAMMLELLIVARRLGVDAALEAQLKERWSFLFDDIMGGLPKMPPKAYRWGPEMLEIAQTCESVGMTAGLFRGAADMYAFVAATQLGKETTENRDKSRKGIDIARMLADDPR